MNQDSGQSPGQIQLNPPIRRPKSGFGRRLLLGFGMVFMVAALILLVLFIAYPNEMGLLFSAISSSANSPSQNSTFSSAGVSFKYPANWVPVNLTVFSGLFSKNTQNATISSRFGNKSEVGLIVPSSEVVRFISNGPGLLSQYLANPSNFSAPPFLSFVASGAITVLKTNFSLVYSIKEKVPNATVLNRTVGGYPGVFVSFTNQTVLNVRESFAELAISESNGNVCFVFGFAGQPNEVASVNQSFNRALNSVSCSFNRLKMTIPVALLDQLLNVLG